ncbi:MAG: pyruvate formate lyase family protein, partial [Eubacteriales bacterium]|nr:pyruvate formate lyase family protein [Eubacteriales bacterium]
TYEERLRLLKIKKLEHTKKKKEQQGYMNADDYGTIPFPDDYSFKPLPNSPNGGFYGYRGMADNFCALLEVHPVYADPLEILCCRWSDMLSNYRKNKRWDEIRFPYDELKPCQAKYNITSGIDNDAHLACDYTIGLSLGFPGLLDKIRHYAGMNPDRKEFYEAEERIMLAILKFIGRHIEKIRTLLADEHRPEIRETLEQMLEANIHIMSRPPETFLEACQWVAYFNCVSRIYTRDGAGFQMDGLLKPYYDRDIEKGILDDEKARFILADLLLIDPHYYQLSGVDENDRDITNHLSYLILEAAHMLNISANLTVRVHENCDPGFLKKAVEYLFTDRNGWPRFCGDDSLAKGYMRNSPSIDKKTARSRIAVGCNWMCIPGIECPMNDTVKINIARVMEAAVNDLEKTDTDKFSTAKLFSLFEEHLVAAIDCTAAGINLHLDHQWEVTPELVMNLMMKNTIEKGLDITQCAELFTTGIDGAGLAIAADSFAALQQRIEIEKRITWEEIFACLKNNYQGPDGGKIRAMMQSSEKYCMGGSLGDKWARKITESFTRLIKAHKMPEGRLLVPGWFSWSRTIEYGSVTGATANGRKAGEPISHGANPNPGFSKNGAGTALSNGIASVQPGYGNTAPLQLEFDPGITMEEGGADRVVDLIKTHFKLGGTLININVLDGEKLLKAHENPDLYPDLVVRVTGFTAYFAVLSPEFRQLVVDRFVRGF